MLAAYDPEVHSVDASERSDELQKLISQLSRMVNEKSLALPHLPCQNCSEQ
jgi:hypothetical protein